MKNKELQFLIVGGLVAYFLVKRQSPQAPYPYYRYPQVPQAPQANNGQAFQNWVASIVTAYGTISDLWQPGGPFYKVPTNDIYDIINQTNNNPYSPGANQSGWG